MSAAQNLQVQILFIKSAEDEATLGFAVPDSVFEFHLQQAIEKLLKALIAAHGSAYPLTHDLQMLLNQAKSLGEIFPVFPVALQKFTKAGVASRYDIGVELSHGERERYRELVKQLREFVTTRVDGLP